jgi:hypothetical protein
MAAVPRVDKKVYFRGAVLALNGGEEPPLREAAKTLGVMRGQCVGESKKIIHLHFETITKKIKKMKLKKIALTLCFFLVVSTRLLSQYYYIPDENLRKQFPSELIINDSLLDTTKIHGWLWLDLSGKEIDNLDGLQHFKQVWYLNVSNNKIKELINLPPNLTNLHCSGNDINELTNLPATLEYLDCSDNKIKTINNLPTNLKTLKCANNVIEILANLPDNLKYLDFSSNLMKYFPILPLGLESVNYYDNPIEINKLPEVFKNAIPCIHPNQNCLPYELINWKLLNNNIKDTIFEILELKVSINTEHSWGLGSETRKLHFIKANEELICENENRCYYPGEANFNKEIINENIKNEHSFSIEKLEEFLKNLYNKKMKLEFQIGDSIETINLRTKRNGYPSSSRSCIDCSHSSYKYEIYTTKDTINLTYSSQTFLDGAIYVIFSPDINPPEPIFHILNSLYACKLDEMVFKRRLDDYFPFSLRNVIGWEKNYK